VAKMSPVGRPRETLDEIRKFADVGYDHIYIHQIGPNQEEFFKFYEKSILPGCLMYLSLMKSSRTNMWHLVIASAVDLGRHLHKYS
jgi:hypothetical protein